MYEDFLKFHFLKDECVDIENIITTPFDDNKKHIISEQMLLILLKKFIAYGDYETFDIYNYTITDNDYMKIIELQLAIVSELEDVHESKFDEHHFLYANYHFNIKMNILNAMTRMYFMVEKLARSKSNFDEDTQKQFRDYYNDFKLKFGYTPVEYLALISWEVLRLFGDDILLSSKSIWRNLDIEYQDFKNSKRVIDVLKFLTSPVSEYKNWAQETQNNEWDFSQFYFKPFLSDNKNNYIVTSDSMINNAIFGGFYNLIRMCYPKESKKAMAFFGKIFENYIQELSRNSISSDYEFIDEFKISSVKSEIRSSDTYIKKKSDLLVVEAKGILPYLEALSNKEKYKENYKRLFKDPIIQADKNLNKIQYEYFPNIENCYIIALTLDNVNAVPMYYNEIRNQIEKDKKCMITKYFFNINIEEYEMLMALMEQGEDIFSLLKEYFDKEKLKPFLSHMLDKYPTVKRAKFIENIFSKLEVEMSEILKNKK